MYVVEHAHTAADGQVRFWHRAIGWKLVKIDKAGRFRIEHLPEGRVALLVLPHELTSWEVLVVEPDRDTLGGLDKAADDARANAVAAGAVAADRAMSGPDADGLRELFARAVS